MPLHAPFLREIIKLMAYIYKQTFFDDGIRPLEEASLSIAGLAVLYGLSVCMVFPIHIADKGEREKYLVDKYQEYLRHFASLSFPDLQNAESFR